MKKLENAENFRADPNLLNEMEDLKKDKNRLERKIEKLTEESKKMQEKLEKSGKSNENSEEWKELVKKFFSKENFFFNSHISNKQLTTNSILF